MRGGYEVVRRIDLGRANRPGEPIDSLAESLEERLTGTVRPCRIRPDEKSAF